METSVNQGQRAAEKAAQQAANNPQSILSRVRNVNSQQMIAVGVTTAEVIGFFSLGEMLGRMKLVGYRSSAPMNSHDHS